MELYLIRHAEAVDLGERGTTKDSDRPLTDRGFEQARRVGRGLERLKVSFDRVVTSPYIRARQTTETLVRELSRTPEVVECEDLVPESRPRSTAAFLEDFTGERLALVGHNPHMSIFVAWLIGSRKAQIEMTKAGVAYLTGSGVGKGDLILQWLVGPEWFHV